jgi:hypothetical protein
MWYYSSMETHLDPFDNIQCEESIPEYWEGSPEPEPLTPEELEDFAKVQFNEWMNRNLNT